MVSRRYSSALYELAEEKKNLSAIYAQVLDVLELCKSNDVFKQMVVSPVIQSADKVKAIQQLFAKKLQSDLYNFLLFLIRKRRLEMLELVLNEFCDLYDQNNNVLHAHVKSANGLSASQLKSINTYLKKLTNKEVKLTDAADKSLVGGYQIKVGDIVIDQSVRNQLEKLKSALTAG